MIICDPQLGCSDRLVVEDLSTEQAWQFSQEFRLASNFSGPFNFSVGGNYLHYETTEKYYVFSNTFTMILAEQCTAAMTHLAPMSYDRDALTMAEAIHRRLQGGSVLRNDAIYRSQSAHIARRSRGTIISSAEIPMC